MNTLYIGSGFVGTCSAAVSADSGHNVLVYDIDENKIKALGSEDRDTIDSCIFEDGLCDLLIRHKERIEFTTNYSKVESFLDDCDGIFMCLPTPEIGDTGESNLKYYYDAAEKLAKSMVKRNKGAQDKYIIFPENEELLKMDKYHVGKKISNDFIYISNVNEQWINENELRAMLDL